MAVVINKNLCKEAVLEAIFDILGLIPNCVFIIVEVMRCGLRTKLEYCMQVTRFVRKETSPDATSVGSFSEHSHVFTSVIPPEPHIY